jgi:hypothetical protein
MVSSPMVPIFSLPTFSWLSQFTLSFACSFGSHSISRFLWSSDPLPYGQLLSWCFLKEMSNIWHTCSVLKLRTFLLSTSIIRYTWFLFWPFSFWSLSFVLGRCSFWNNITADWPSIWLIMCLSISLELHIMWLWMDIETYYWGYFMGYHTWIIDWRSRLFFLLNLVSWCFHGPYWEVSNVFIRSRKYGSIS